ncbi:MAG: DUF3568 family protein [Syntrophales bacterium]|nr:DUF3568 family protein [Syntrophales bacterium]
MRNRISPLPALLLVTALLTGCAVLPFLSFLPLVGSAYGGYVAWKGGEATKYYAFDLETTYRAVIQASDHLKLEATLTKSAPKEGYSLETKGNVPMHIDMLRLEEKNVTSVVVNISAFGDKHYVELFYSLIDDNLPKKTTVEKENPDKGNNKREDYLYRSYNYGESADKWDIDWNKGRASK